MAYDLRHEELYPFKNVLIPVTATMDILIIYVND